MNEQGYVALVVESEADVSAVVARALQAAGYDTEMVPTEDEALAWLGTATPRLVVVDMVLPGASGDQIVGHVRSSERFGDTQTIVLTTHDGLAAALRSDADWVLLKPVNLHLLTGLSRDLQLPWESLGDRV